MHRKVSTNRPRIIFNLLCPLKPFTLYVPDLCNIFRLVTYILFGEELFCADKHINQLAITVSAVLDKLCTWVAVKKLSLNDSKTSYVLFGKFNARVVITVTGTYIEKVRVAKFLGEK